MPVAIFWEPHALGNKIETKSDAVAVIKTLRETFGANDKHPLAPIVLGKNHIFTLRSLAGGQANTVFGEIADLIEKHGRLRVWGTE